jgi:outer membrane immunogenic protein
VDRLWWWRNPHSSEHSEHGTPIAQVRVRLPNGLAFDSGGRAGITFDQWMLYGTGGLAIADVSRKSWVTGAPPANGHLIGSDDKTKTGWTAGGGAAFALTDHVTLKAEGLYYDLGHISTHSTDPKDPQSSVLVTDQDINGAIVRGGLDYKF